MTAQGRGRIQVSVRPGDGDIAAATRWTGRLLSGVPFSRNGAPPTVVMAGLDPAIHDEVQQFSRKF
jgi:hypothetical protein